MSLRSNTLTTGKFHNALSHTILPYLWNISAIETKNMWPQQLAGNKNGNRSNRSQVVLVLMTISHKRSSQNTYFGRS